MAFSAALFSFFLMGLLSSGGFSTSAVGCMNAECHRCLYMYKSLGRDREEKGGMVSTLKLCVCSSRTNIFCFPWIFWKVSVSVQCRIKIISKIHLLLCLLSPLCFYVAPATSSPREKGTQYFFWWNKRKEQPHEVEGALLSDIFRFDF